MAHKYSVCFGVDKEDHLCPVIEPAFCFFPTREYTGLDFMIHAPFLLTDSREGIRAGDKHNNVMIKLLSELAADAIVYLRDIGVKKSKRLIDDNILNIIPTNKNNFSDLDDKRQISFMPFYSAIQNKFKSEALLPSSEGYVLKGHAYRTAESQLIRVFSDEQLADICNDKNAK